MKNAPTNTLTNALLAALLLLSSRVAVAKDLDHAAIAKKYSFDQLQEVANYLLARVENDPLAKGKQILTCDVTIDQANRWSGGEVHSLIDEKSPKRLAEYETSPEKFTERIKTCDRDCSCAPYALLFERLSEPVARSAAHEGNAKILKEQLAKGSKNQTLACAKKNHVVLQKRFA